MRYGCVNIKPSLPSWDWLVPLGQAVEKPNRAETRPSHHSKNKMSAVFLSFLPSLSLLLTNRSYVNRRVDVTLFDSTSKAVYSICLEYALGKHVISFLIAFCKISLMQSKQGAKKQCLNISKQVGL